MTREEAKELLPIIQAFADGKQIEYGIDGENWINTVTPTWNSDYVYRIKPEPKYRPFENEEECWQEMLKHQPFGWLLHKQKKSHEFIKSELTGTSIYKIVFKEYTFADGTPFGIKEE